MITPSEALDLIAQAPEAKQKTPADLRKAAQDCERKAEAKVRLVVRENGNRRKARAQSRERDAEKLRVYAQVTRMAADEVERRKCSTVGAALRSPVARLVGRLFSRRDLMAESAT